MVSLAAGGRCPVDVPEMSGRMPTWVLPSRPEGSGRHSPGLVISSSFQWPAFRLPDFTLRSLIYPPEYHADAPLTAARSATFAHRCALSFRYSPWDLRDVAVAVGSMSAVVLPCAAGFVRDERRVLQSERATRCVGRGRGRLRGCVDGPAGIGRVRRCRMGCTSPFVPSSPSILLILLLRIRRNGLSRSADHRPAHAEIAPRGRTRLSSAPSRRSCTGDARCRVGRCALPELVPSSMSIPF
ncbi:hypothetical protein DFH07DRAFT_460673 [Mycena maculata]|uniref:Uncharacterized protein n=1 Tax=Mycena maculata TaxID=230809 RepID=A0AAD7J4V7_9AGAR|nr:hypothetical protein DFH07DRAFT_460673 [Mycena maculata]